MRALSFQDTSEHDAEHGDGGKDEETAGRGE
jgi:hypothetical protein